MTQGELKKEAAPVACCAIVLHEPSLEAKAPIARVGHLNCRVVLQAEQMQRLFFS